MNKLEYVKGHSFVWPYGTSDIDVDFEWHSQYLSGFYYVRRLKSITFDGYTVDAKNSTLSMYDVDNRDLIIRNRDQPLFMSHVRRLARYADNIRQYGDQHNESNIKMVGLHDGHAFFQLIRNFDQGYEIHQEVTVEDDFSHARPQPHGTQEVMDAINLWQNQT